MAGPLVVGLTGGIGSGKSTVGAEFAKLGIDVIDADAVSHAMTAVGAPGAVAIRAELGEQFFHPDGSLDRAALRQAVFASPELRKKLEAILHPPIRAEMARRVAASRSPYVLLMVPLLLESGRKRIPFDRLLVVDCPEDEQVRRVQERSGLTADEVQAIMRTQVDRATRLAAADDVVDNGGPASGLAEQVARLDALYRRLAAPGRDPAAQAG